jgi:outer membrane protein OmpA-like peptidoglycan-associated protein
MGGWLTPRWGAEVSYFQTKFDFRLPGYPEGTEKQFLLSGLFRPTLQTGPATPFLSAGLALVQTPPFYSNGPRTLSSLGVHAGAGLRFPLPLDATASLQARVVAVLGPAEHTELQLLAGLGFRWGAPGMANRAATQTSASVPPPPMEPPAAPPAPQARECLEPAPVQEPGAPETSRKQEPPAEPLEVPVISFQAGKATLSSAGVSDLFRLAGHLRKRSGDYRLVVMGHASQEGSRAFNQALSLRRAQAVAWVLGLQGIPASTMKVMGQGPDEPADTNHTPQGRARNRRVDMRLEMPAR